MLDNSSSVTKYTIPLMLFVLLSACSPSIDETPISLLDIYEIISTKEFVDMTHTFEPGIPHWPGFPDEKRETIYGYEEGEGTLGNGFFAETYTLAGQWGTHVDPPAHFVRGSKTLDQIHVKKMFLPLVLIDVHEKVRENPDYTLTDEDVWSWADKHGPIPEDAFVVMRTDWSKRWPDPSAMRNEDEKGTAHYPGWGPDALKILCEVYEISAIGHETIDTDPGISTSQGDYSMEKYVLSHNLYQVEMLTNLDRVPEYGALAVVSFPKPKNGSGFPARVFAILP